MTAPGLLDGRHCANCAAPLPRGSTGRPATFCSDRCRQTAHRAVTKPLPPTGATPTPEPRAALSDPAPGRSLAAIAGGIPTPVDPVFGPARAYMSLVAHGGTGKATWRAAFGTDGGRGTVPVGPAMPRRHTHRLLEMLNGRLT